MRFAPLSFADMSRIIDRAVDPSQAAPKPKMTDAIKRIGTFGVKAKLSAANHVMKRLVIRMGFLPILSLYDPKNETDVNSATG